METRQLQQALLPKMKEIRSYLIRLGAAPADAEDAVQDAVYKAVLYVESIDAAKFGAWLYRAAINRYYDMCRRQKRIHLPLDAVEPADPELPEDRLLQREAREEIEQVLGALPPAYRQLLIMKYEQELSYREIAELLGLRPEAVKSGLYRARQLFQTKYGEVVRHEDTR